MSNSPYEASEDEIAEAVSRFDALYGDMERVLWCLSMNSRAALLEGASDSPILDQLVWKLRGWWSVQGASRETGKAMARALVTMDWSSALFEPIDIPPVGGEEEAVQRVANLVEKTQEFGAPRREYSLASKVLHLLLPWRIPVYDSFVRTQLGIPEPTDPKQAYSRVTNELFRAARNVTTANPPWMGDLEPRSLFRAFDKYYWWVGGGNNTASPPVKNPWSVIEELGLDLP